MTGLRRRCCLCYASASKVGTEERSGTVNMVATLLLISLAASAALAQDSSPIAAEVREALAAGECERAMRIATERTTAAVDDGQAFRLLGDAQRCLHQHRPAVLSYRRAQALGVEDPTLRKLIAQVSQQLVTLSVATQGVDWTHPPTFALKVRDELIEPLEWGRQGVLFVDLPAGEHLELRMVGLGYEPARVALEPQRAGASAKAAIEARYLGLATLELKPWQGDFSVDLKDGYRVREDVLPGSYDLTAGAVLVRVESPTGTGEQHLELAVGTSTELEVGGLVPGQVTFTEVPAGSVIRFNLRGDEPQAVEVGWPEQTPDERLGLPLVTVPMKDLPTGTYDFTLEQPWLGSLEGQFFAVGGDVGAHRVPWNQLPGAEPMAQAYAAWLEANAAQGALGAPGPRAVVGFSVGGAALIGAGVNALLGWQARKNVQDLGWAYDIALNEGRTEDAQLYYQRRDEARDRARALWIATGSTAALCGVSVAYSFGQVGKERARKEDGPQWDPKALEPILPVPGVEQAPVEEAPEPAAEG